MSFGGKSWGEHHTGPDVPGACPQCNVYHDLNQATDLNEKRREAARALAWARHKRWVGAEDSHSHKRS